jgi:hypothetical protein
VVALRLTLDCDRMRGSIGGRMPLTKRRISLDAGFDTERARRAGARRDGRRRDGPQWGAKQWGAKQWGAKQWGAKQWGAEQWGAKQ